MTESRRTALPDHAVVEVGHGENEVEIVPLKHAVGDGELLEAAFCRSAYAGRDAYATIETAVAVAEMSSKR